MLKSAPVLLNLGCGASFHPDWLNVDLVAADPSVLVHNLREPLPFGDQSFAAVYHSHVLEHLPRERALPFIRECYRVLRAGGFLRVAVPDLERIATLELLEPARESEGQTDSRISYKGPRPGRNEPASVPGHGSYPSKIPAVWRLPRRERAEAAQSGPLQPRQRLVGYAR